MVPRGLGPISITKPRIIIIDERIDELVSIRKPRIRHWQFTIRKVGIFCPRIRSGAGSGKEIKGLRGGDFAQHAPEEPSMSGIEAVPVKKPEKQPGWKAGQLQKFRFSTLQTETLSIGFSNFEKWYHELKKPALWKMEHFYADVPAEFD